LSPNLANYDDDIFFIWPLTPCSVSCICKLVSPLQQLITLEDRVHEPLSSADSCCVCVWMEATFVQRSLCSWPQPPYTRLPCYCLPREKGKNLAGAFMLIFDMLVNRRRNYLKQTKLAANGYKELLFTYWFMNKFTQLFNYLIIILLCVTLGVELA